MGVPAMFRWLSQKYPKIISPVIEDLPREVDGQTIPVDGTTPNPNGEEMDNLYLDMNGIVHPCTHPEDKPAPETEGEMMVEVFRYTERVVKMARPRKLLMMAVDGVAPRAKLNQQRARRFKAAKDAKEEAEQKEEFVKMLKTQNNGILTDAELANANKKRWDSNAITPGTPFMDMLAASLQYWVTYKLNTDAMWAKLKIIISDATVPGEGEHKIMEFIRAQRSTPDHNPNTRHVLYGLDADLIMLGLATHEPHFRVLREDVFFQSGKAGACHRCGQQGHIAVDCKGEPKQKQGEFDEKGSKPSLKPFIWLHVSVLREYLAIEMHPPTQKFPFDVERAIDDWVFMCFFCGNDFLPHLPSLDIREQGIDTLTAIWRDNIPLIGGYVTRDGHVDLDKVQQLLGGLAKQEDAIFKRRHDIEQRKENAAKRRKMQAEESRSNHIPKGKYAHDWAPPASEIPGGLTPLGSGLTHSQIVNPSANAPNSTPDNKSAAAIMKERLMSNKTSPSQNSTPAGTSPASGPSLNGDNTVTPPSALTKKRKAGELDDDETGTPGRDSPLPKPKRPEADEPPPDNIRLWDEGYADRYYESKFHVSPDNHEFRHQVARDYVEGLCWVLLYYYQGCPSWTWYYPHHYAPFAADFVDIPSMNVTFDGGHPFRPYEQLMGVLPAASNHTIPEVFRSLMTDDESDIKDFYPENFDVDLNGKKFSWQGVVLLPFLDEKRLLAAMGERYPLLSEDEVRRNEFGKPFLYLSDAHPLYEDFSGAFHSKDAGAPKVNLDTLKSDGLAGKVEKNEDCMPYGIRSFPGEASLMMADVEDDRSISVCYEIPRSTSVHKSMLLRGVKMPPEALDHGDRVSTREKASRTGRSYGGAPLHEGRGRDGPRINYANRGPPAHQNGDAARPNPFAQHLDPSFVPPQGKNMMPFPPPPYQIPPYGNQAPYSNGNYAGMPPQPPQWGPPPPYQNSRTPSHMHSRPPRGNPNKPPGGYDRPPPGPPALPIHSGGWGGGQPMGVPQGYGGGYGGHQGYGNYGPPPGRGGGHRGRGRGGGGYR